MSKLLKTNTDEYTTVEWSEAPDELANLPITELEKMAQAKKENAMNINNLVSNNYKQIGDILQNDNITDKTRNNIHDKIEKILQPMKETMLESNKQAQEFCNKLAEIGKKYTPALKQAFETLAITPSKWLIDGIKSEPYLTLHVLSFTVASVPGLMASIFWEDYNKKKKKSAKK